MRYEEGGNKEFPAFAAAVDAFCRDYWDHMRKEEEKVFPLAEKLLAPPPIGAGPEAARR